MTFKAISSAVVCTFFMGLFACEQPAVTETNNLVAVDSASMAKHLATLSSDEFEGRLPFTRGEAITVAYLEDAFKNMGLAPGNNGSYVQEVPMVSINSVPETPLQVKGAKGSLSLEWQKDFVAYTERSEAETVLENSELVFAGFGIVAPEYGWNDYEGLDVKGKTVVVLVNDPGFGTNDSTFFKGNTMTYYGRWVYKYEEAARQGAAGVLIVHETNPAGYPWQVVRNSWTGSKLTLQSPDGNAGKCQVQGWITVEKAVEIFKLSGKEITNFSGMARTKGFRPIPLGLTVSVKLKNELKTDVSKNVIAMLPGTERPEEYLIYTAHWDHLGIGVPIDGDSIYNGARDNATGISTLLGIAKAFTAQPEKPKRTVVFLAVTAEEQGLFGSEYYAKNPVFPLANTVANINMDGMNTLGKMRDLTVIGFGQSELEDMAGEIAARDGRYLLPDPNPGAGYFFRSDHFNFAKVGVPALYVKGGADQWEKGKAWTAERTAEYTANNYHRPADEFSPDWDLSGLVQDANLLLEVGLKVANEAIYPQWKEGSEFRNIRRK